MRLFRKDKKRGSNALRLQPLSSELRLERFLDKSDQAELRVDYEYLFDSSKIAKVS